MCGIIAITGVAPVQERLLDGLGHLEYRGYDSVGIAVHTDQDISICKIAGELEKLRATVNGVASKGVSGIAHTRWATHGRADQSNAHPHRAGGVAVVHNGIIENFRSIRTRLSEAGHVFDSDTDSEVVAHLISAGLQRGLDPEEAFAVAIPELTGAYAIVAVFDHEPGVLYAACDGSPLVAASDGREVFIASDAHTVYTVSRYVEDIVYLQDGDTLRAAAGKMTVRAATGEEVTRPPHRMTDRAPASGKGGHQHYMKKEIEEQPEAITHTLSGLTDLSAGVSSPPDGLASMFASADRAVAIACGSSFIAAGVARFWFESIADLYLETAVASEYRYSHPCPPRTGPALLISQSGETADTLAALAWCGERGIPTVGVCNVANSSLDRKAGVRVRTAAGIERSVASTKTFTTQLAALAVMSLVAGRARGTIDEEEERRLIGELAGVPRLVAETLKKEQEFASLSETLAAAPRVFFLGRGAMFPLAMEGALKLKEVSYIHAEGLAAGELKHGPLALIEEGTPVIATVANNHVLSKTLSNLHEVRARGAEVIILVEGPACDLMSEIDARVVVLPESGPMALPFVGAVAYQMIAYHAALRLGRSIDKPRNLAKSVTVE